MTEVNMPGDGVRHFTLTARIVFLPTLLLVLFYFLILGANSAGAAVFNSIDGTVIFGEATGNFFGDGRDIKVELTGRPISDYDFTLGERPNSDEDAAYDVVYMDENWKIEEGKDIVCMQYYLRVTSPGQRAVQYGPKFATAGSLSRNFKLCDVDGDGIPEVFFCYDAGTSAGIENAVAVSLKGGEYREIFNIENAEYEDNALLLPVLETKLYPGFFIQISAKSQGNLKHGALRASMLLDLNDDPGRKEYYTDYIFTNDGEPMHGVYAPYIDAGFRHSGIADLDGDGREEIFGAMPVNGSSNADEIAYLNVAYKWENDNWQICFLSIMDISSPLEGLSAELVSNPSMYP